MSREDAFKVEGAVVEALPNLTYRVELANGHRLLAFVAGKARMSLARLAHFGIGAPAPQETACPGHAQAPEGLAEQVDSGSQS